MKKTGFIMSWAAVFVVSYLTLSSLDMVPVELSEANYRFTESIRSLFSHTQDSQAAVIQSLTNNAHADEALLLKEDILPDRIVIAKISVDAPVQNPETRDVGVLDRALLEGVVRYPGSGGLDDESNMFLFGHSTGYRTVQNQAFKAFNRLGELQIGDTVSVRSGKTEYVYKVSSVSHVESDSALITLSTGKKKLTLSTCDTFGAKTDRFVVEADFLQAVPLPEATF